MGKGSRNRITRALDRADNPQKYREKKKAPKWLGVTLTVVVVLILAAAITLSTLSSSGVFKRNTTVVRTEHFEVTGTMMEYYFNERYTEYINNYYYYIYLGYVKLDVNTSLKEQKKDENGTWFDYFEDLTKTRVSQILAYCEGAYSEGITLDKEDKELVESNIEAIKSAAEQAGLPLKGYLNTTYGKGVTIKDIRKAIELSTLATKYAEIISDRYYDAITADEINKYYDEHYEDYITANYLSYKFEVKKDTVKKDDYKTTEEYDAAVAKAEQDYATKKAEFFTKAMELAKKENADDFTKYVQDYLEATKKAETGKDLTDEEKEDIQETIDALETEKFAYGYDSELECWLFGFVFEKETEEETEGEETEGEETEGETEEEGDGAATASEESTEDTSNDKEEDKKPEKTDIAKLNTTKVIVDDSKDKDGTYSVTAYFVTREAGRDEDLTKDVYYAVFTAEQTDPAAALVSEFGAAATKDLATFEALAEAKGSSYYTDIVDNGKGGFGYDEVDEWLFHADRKPGDITSIKLESYNLVVYLVENGDAEWYASIHSTLVGEKTEAWVEAEIEKLGLKFDQNFIDDIDA